ncbi:hypothetical protein JKF63_01501 [Porcisia hertigi]|uniref:Uncharacterized protein n=1 Tax=Porcisia hertigi TaxID=2761500 RepID=A0A836KZH9_9TRYP|nr:hypothetical protein JKF63_01501 [Porcisia hertigi]
MTSNPYIARHYGGSMEVMSNGREDEVDAEVGYRRFPAAQHMTHTFFSPAKGRGAPSTAVVSSLGINNAYKASTPDARETVSLHEGLVLDEFPSRPQTPRHASSNTSLPPLLPAERLSLVHSDSLRDRSAELHRECVKALTNSSTSLSGDREGQGIKAAPSSGKTHISFDFNVLEATRQDTASGQVNRSATVPTGTIDPARGGCPTSDEAVLMVTSQKSLGVAQSKSSTADTPLAAPEAVGNTTVNETLHRLRDALAQAQFVLNKSPLPGAAGALPPPPPLMSHGLEEQPQPQSLAGPPAMASTFSPRDKKTTSQHLLDDVSPLANTPAPLEAFSPVERRVGLTAEMPFRASFADTTGMVGVPDETCFMILCAVAHPSAIMARRIRRRGPTASTAQEGQGFSGDHSPFGVGPETSSRHAAPHRIAEVRSPPAAVSGVVLAEPTTASRQPQTSSSPNTDREGHPSFRVSTRGSAPKRSSKHHQHEDTSLLPGLAEFLRAGNPYGFSSLSAVAHTKPPAPLRATASARGLRRGLGHSSASAVTATAVVGHPASLSFPRSSSGAVQSTTDHAMTMSSLPPYAQREDSTAVVDVSPRRRSTSTRRVDSMPSYAQPTVSWLSKGSEASADVFPMSRVASPQTSPLKDPATASRDGAPNEGVLL